MKSAPAIPARPVSHTRRSPSPIFQLSPFARPAALSIDSSLARSRRLASALHSFSLAGLPVARARPAWRRVDAPDRVSVGPSDQVAGVQTGSLMMWGKADFSAAGSRSVHSSFFLFTPFARLPEAFCVRPWRQASHALSVLMLCVVAIDGRH
jgi:hypothetical protein